MINEGSSLDEFQKLNREIYLVTNDREYGLVEMFSRLHRHVTHVLKAVRKEKYEFMEYHLCMALSWSLAIANRLHINVSDEMWARFPGLCPYCLSAPCRCKERRRVRRKLAGKSNSERPVSLSDWQEMFAKVYPNVIYVSAMHLAEEAGEVDEAIRNYQATHKEEWFKKSVEELIDLITNIFGVANCRKLSINIGMAGYFANGCPGCKKLPCCCGYVAVDQPNCLRK